MSEPDNPKRPWWKLHFSTKVVIAVVVCGLILANLPGQEVPRALVPDSGKYGPHYYLVSSCEHGWPARYLTRDPSGKLLDSWTACWQLTDGVREFSPLLLVLNLMVTVLLMAVAAAVFELWRRRRASLFRFRLIELFGVMTLAALGAGWLQYQIRSAAAERVALTEAAEDHKERLPEDGFGQSVTYEHRGPTFLRALAGKHDPLVFFDHVVQADVIDANPRFADRFPHLKCVAPNPNGLDEIDARAIAKLQNLEAIDLMMSGLGTLSDFPPLRKLRGINLYQGSASEQNLIWLGRCTNLEQIELCDVNIGDEGLRHLVGLKKLKSFSAGGGYEGPEFSDGCFELLSQFDGLEELWLSGEFRGDKVEMLLPLKQLRSLDLSSASFSPANLKRLEEFGHLKWLAVSGSAISEADIARLQAALPNCEVGGP